MGGFYESSVSQERLNVINLGYMVEVQLRKDRELGLFVQFLFLKFVD